MKMLKSRYGFLFLISQVVLVPTYGITAKFSYSKVSSCAPAVVVFTNNSSRGPGITYTWDFGLGAIVSATDYSVKEQFYTKAGQYNVKLKVSDGINSDSTSSVVTIIMGPVAKFTADPANGCPPLPVAFKSISVAGESAIIKTSWDFRNGDYREGTAVQYQYNRTGQYNVILKVTDSNGCTSQLESEKIITVADKPRVDFAASDTFGCSPPLNVSFVNLSKGSSALTYKWNYGNGTTSTDFSNSCVYDTVGTYSVSLKATDQFGCSDSLTKDSYISVGYKKGTLSVYDARDKIFSRSFLCNGLYRFVYSDPDLPSYTWSITDNNITSTFKGKNSLTYKVTGSGKIVVRLVFGRSSFCTDSITLSFVKSYIKAAFTLKDTMYCSVPRTVSLTNSSQNADKVAWYLSDKFLSNEKVTSYSITEKDLPGETYEQLYSHQINVIKLPVKLVASNGGVCYDSVTKIVNIVKPVARFMPDKVSGCVPLQVSFSDSSRSVFKIDSYTYRIGSDQVTSLNKIPVNYTITKPGEYNVTEIIKSEICYDTSRIVKIVAGDKLLPDFTVSPSEVCNGGNITLSGNTGNNSNVSMWRFSSSGLFDLNLKSRPDTTISVYSDSTGFKNVSLQVDYNGCFSDTTKKNILKIKGPSGSFTGSFSCDSSMKYRFKSAIKPATSLVWNIDTSTVNDIDSLDYIFPKSGDYTVKITATDSPSGCILDRTKIFRVRQVMSAFALNDTIFCAGDSVKMDGSLSEDFINTCYNEGFLWDFGDDSPPRRYFLSKYSHIYTARGNDTISLVVTGDNGCSDTSRQVVHIYRPSGSFTSDKTSGCLPELSVNFKNTSTDTTIVRWIWNFGDNSADSSNSLNITHLFSNDIQTTYYPALTVYDAWSCSSNYAIPTHLIGINNDFQANDNAICLGEEVTFAPADSSLTNLYWDFGDGTSSTGTNTHTYTKAGLFNVSLAAKKEGCQDTLTKTNYIYVEKANASFIASDSILKCYPATISFVHDNLINSPAVEYLWTFGPNVLTDRSSGNVKYTFTRPGTINTKLTVRTLNGCEASSSKKISISGPDGSVSFTPNDICYNDAVTFRLDSMKNVSQWKWFFGDGSTSTANPVAHRYTSRGKIVPSVQLISPTCTAIRLLDTLYISKVQALFKSSDSIYTYCYGTKVDLLNNSLNANLWSWAVDNVQVSTGYVINDVTFNVPGDHYIRLVAKEAGGCADTLTKKFTIYPIPVFSITGDSVLCAGQNSVSLSVAKNTGDKIKWTPATGLNNTAVFTVIASPVITTTYTAKVTNSLGCSAAEEKTIRVNQPFDLSRSPMNDTSIFIGQGIQLAINTSESNVSYEWSPARNISCINCNNPWVYPSESTTYNVTVNNGCFNISDNFNIEVIKDFYLEAPSAFTPNGDSNNDIFRFEAKGILEFDLKIFNRWGEIVFTSDDVSQGWDGNVNGHAQNIDTYKYYVKAKSIHGYEFERGGEFLLLR
ncbi:MAG: PKD domain-containing protein [Bacteroidia bacterium]|nr:PKD domain-containing protein [Bacteroidia bacterium]